MLEICISHLNGKGRRNEKQTCLEHSTNRRLNSPNKGTMYCSPCKQEVIEYSRKCGKIKRDMAKHSNRKYRFLIYPNS